MKKIGLLFTVFFAVVLGACAPQADLLGALPVRVQGTLASTLTLASTEIPTATPTPTPTPLAGYVPEGAVRNFGRGQILDIAVSPSGDFIAIASMGGTYILDGAKLTEITFIANENPNHSSNAVDFSPDGDLLVIGSGIQFGEGVRSLNLIETHNWTTVKQLSSQHGSYVIFSPVQPLIAINGYSTISTWNYDTNEWKIIYNAPAQTYVNDIVFLRDGTLLLANQNRVLRIQTADGQILSRYNQFTEVVQGLAASPDGRMFAAYERHKFLVLDVETGEIVFQNEDLDMSGLADPDIIFSSNGEEVYVGYENEIRYWRISDGNAGRLQNPDSEVAQWYTHAGIVADQFFVSGSDEQTVTAWDLATGKTVPVYSELFSNELTPVFSPDGNRIMVGATLFDFSTGQRLHDFSFPPFTAQFSPKGSYIGLAGFENGFVYDASTFEQLCRLDVGHSVVWFSEDEVIFGYPRIGDFIVKRVSACRELRTFQAQSKDSMFAMSPDGSILLEGTGHEIEDGTVYAYDVLTGDLLYELNRLGGSLYRFAFSSDNRFAAASILFRYGERTLVFDLKSGLEIGAIPSNIYGLTYSGRATPNFMIQDHLIHTYRGLWDAETASSLKNFSLASLGITVEEIAVSPDGELVAAMGPLWGLNGPLRILVLETMSGNVLYEFSGHAPIFPTSSLVFSPDSQSLVTSTDDGAVLVWDTSH